MTLLGHLRTCLNDARLAGNPVNYFRFVQATIILGQIFASIRVFWFNQASILIFMNFSSRKDFSVLGTIRYTKMILFF